MFDPDKGESDMKAMDLSDEDKSVRLYETLVQLGVCERKRLVCRQWILQGIIASIVTRFSHLCRLVLQFGSSIEGSSISALTPDMDLAILIKADMVNDASDGKHEEISHLIVPSTFPGYVKLQMLSFGKTLDKTFSENFPTHKPDKSGRLWLKGAYDLEYLYVGLDLDEVFKEEMKRLCDVSKHGPANRAANTDVVWVFEIYDVLNIIPQWVRRKRLYDWPSDHLRKRCLQYPALLVKVGHPFSKEEDIEWRISFSLSERELMFSLNPTQHKCYVTLKMIKHDLLNQALSEEFITSYHLKTCVFWTVENTPEKMWRPEQLLQCVSICLWYMLYFVLTKNCPNYFLPTANLFQRTTFLDVQSSLLNVIIHSVTRLVDVICSIKCADLGHLFKGRFSTKMIEIKEPCFLDLDDITHMRLSILNRLQEDIFLMVNVEKEWWSIETRITRWKQMLKELKRIHIPSIMFGFDHLAIGVAKNILSHQINLRLALCFAAKAIATQDECERFQLIKSTRDCSSNLFTARLTYLTLLFKLNRLSECDEILKDLLKRYSETSAYCQCKYGRMSQEITDFIEKDITTLFENQITCMVFMPEEKGIVPEPLTFELNLPIDDRANEVDLHGYCKGYNSKWASVDGLLYSLFMEYLVYSRLKDDNEKETVLREICSTIASGKLFHKAVGYNLMGWICAREGMLADALNWWRTSLERHPHRNAVNKYCVDFFSKYVGLGKDLKHN